MPVSFFLQVAVLICRSRVSIIHECDVVPNENAFFNCDAFTNERVTGDLAARPDRCAFLDFYEGSDLRFVTNLTPVKVDESTNPNVASEPYVGCYLLMQSSILIHAATISSATSPTTRLVQQLTLGFEVQRLRNV